MLYVCANCTTRYAPAARCPHCKSTDYYEFGREPMAKNTRHGGSSNATATTSAPEAAEAAAEDAAVVEANPADVQVMAQAAEGAGEAPEIAEAVPAAVEPPPDWAPKAEWVAWALSTGMDQAEAEGLTKAALVALAAEVTG